MRNTVQGVGADCGRRFRGKGNILFACPFDEPESFHCVLCTENGKKRVNNAQLEHNKEQKTKQVTMR
jgi:hypothetical protein